MLLTGLAPCGISEKRISRNSKLSTDEGKDFTRDLISERVKSGLAVAKARGKRLGRQAGVRPKSDRLLPKVVAMRAEGRSYRWIARELGISKNTVADIVQRHRANA